MIAKVDDRRDQSIISVKQPMTLRHAKEWLYQIFALVCSVTIETITDYISIWDWFIIVYLIEGVCTKSIYRVCECSIFGSQQKL